MGSAQKGRPTLLTTRSFCLLRGEEPRMYRRVLFSSSVFLLLLPSDAWAQDDVERIQAAVRRGVQYLKSRQGPDGSWKYNQHDVGITALLGLALAENGVQLDDPVLRSAYQYVQTNAPQIAQTYDVSLAILFLVRVGNARDTELIHLLGRRLAAGQLASGGWTYTCPQAVPPAAPASLTNKPSPKPDRTRRAGQLKAAQLTGQFGDNSNTQFAVLGIWAAGRAGLDVSGPMGLIDQRFRSTQSQQGGWGYNGPRGDSDAMTCAGLMALALAKGHKTLEAQMVNRRPDKDRPEGPAERPKMESDSQIDQGIRRVEQFANNINPGSSLYFLWSLERVGVALGMARIGRVDWYGRGAAALVQGQQADGSWRTAHGELADTAFALLFLRRSNLTQGMPQLVSSRSSESGDNRMRSGNVEDLIRTVRPPAEPKEQKDR